MKIKNLLLKKTCNAIIENDIIKLNRKTGKYTFRGYPLHEKQIQKLEEEARMITNTTIWKVLQDNLKSEARKTMNENAKDYNDMMFGKAMLYCLDLQEKILEKIK